MSELLRLGALAWWSYLAPIAVQASLLIVVVAAIDRLLPRRTWPELRSLLWLLVMLKLILPPGLTSPISLVHAIPQSITIAVPAHLLVADGGHRVVVWAQAAVVVWAAGFLLLSLGGWLRYRRLWRRWLATSDDASEFTAPSWIGPLLERCSARVGLRRLPRVVFSQAVRTPFVVGLVRPCVFLPRRLSERFSPQQIEHVLLHELCHLRRLDTWGSAACTAIQLVYWFHPLVWLAQRRLAEVREQSCDRAVARLLGAETESYRRTLLLFARRMIEDPTAGRLAFLRPSNLLLARLRLLERATPDRIWLRRSVTTVLLGALSLAVVPMARGADRVVGEVAELIERPPGCLQLRYLVLRRLAEQEGYSLPATANPPSDDSPSSQHEEPNP